LFIPFVGHYKWWSSSLCSLVQPPVTSSVLTSAPNSVTPSVLVTALRDTLLVACLGKLYAISENNNLCYSWFIFRHRKS
jgi:hypothetical protein